MLKLLKNEREYTTIFHPRTPNHVNNTVIMILIHYTRVFCTDYTHKSVKTVDSNRLPVTVKYFVYLSPLPKKLAVLIKYKLALVYDVIVWPTCI